jgi:predicted TIM-barrel fold metal-dependent hydrolase
MFSFIQRQRILTQFACLGFVCLMSPLIAFSQDANESPSKPAEGSQLEVSQPLEPVPIVAAPLDGREGRDLSIRLFRPQSKLVVPQTPLTRACFPVVDVHTHFLYKMRHNRQALVDYVAMMDRSSIAVSVSLDGQLGSQLDSHIEYLWTDYKDRFAIFANVDWRGAGAIDDPATWACHRPGFAERTAEELAAAVGRGVSGLKVFKQLGLGYQNPDRTLIQVDDPRWDPIWAACAKLGIPVLIHTGDPPSFFDPIDETNERWEELSRHPDWSFHDPKFPRLAELFAARNRVMERHPQTKFIGAHMASSSEDLAQLAQWLDRYPNLYVDFSSRISELGRQPFTSRDFLIKYADRILFGTDGPWPPERLQYYWRFLETHDEAFPYSEKLPPPQGMWAIYGIKLPSDVLSKIYHENAMMIIPGIRERIDKWNAKP